MKIQNNCRNNWKRDKCIAIIDICRKALFLQAEEINWDAHVWYMERFHFLPGWIDPSNPVMTLSFLEVSHEQNRILLKKYMRYSLGITDLSIRALSAEMIYVKNFLVAFPRGNICDITSEQIDKYFRKQQERKIQASTFNKIIMSVLHFFRFLQVRNYIQRVPFCEDYYLKKVIPQHNDRSVEEQVASEILDKLYKFPEEVRIMYLHLWSIGLRVSEVCTLKGNAYYIQGRDFWIQIYQIKMKTYKRIPIPEALYKLMKVYMEKHQIGSDDYVFQNQRGGAYSSGTFRNHMLNYCADNNIQNGEYMLKSHDYRHSIATLFYDNEVSLQSVRDYLGHAHEEMTRQYIDYMPIKLAEANDDYFSNHKSLAANLMK